MLIRAVSTQLSQLSQFKSLYDPALGITSMAGAADVVMEEPVVVTEGSQMLHEMFPDEEDEDKAIIPDTIRFEQK